MPTVIAGPIVMALGAVLVLLGVYGAAPWPWQARRPLARAQVGLRRRVGSASASLAAVGRGTREVVGRSLTVERPPAPTQTTADADDMIAALLSELLTLREEVDGLRAQIEAPAEPPKRRERPTTKTASRRLANARSA